MLAKENVHAQTEATQLIALFRVVSCCLDTFLLTPSDRQTGIIALCKQKDASAVTLYTFYFRINNSSAFHSE